MAVYVMRVVVTVSVKQTYKFGTGVIMEHRRSPRFEVHVPVMFEWVDECGTRRRGGGFTRDISESGVFAWCEGDCPCCRTVISITLLLPGVEPTSKAWRMKSEGYVVRMTDDISEQNGFVALLDETWTKVLASNPR